MKFRFPISPNFSITGQPISRLISGKLAAEYYERIEVMDAVLDKFESVHEAHEQARKIALASQQGGPGFALYLRNFNLEEFSYSDDPTERAYDFRSAQFEKMLRQLVVENGSELLSLRGGNDRLDEFLGRTGPVFTGQAENWRDLVSELIEAAKVIVIVTNGVSPGLSEELQIIGGMGKIDRTLIFLAPYTSTLDDVFKHDERPEEMASLRGNFPQFTQIYEGPRLDGWQPGAIEDKKTPSEWPGAARLATLLTDSYTGRSELQAVRAVPFQILSPSELVSPDHQSARQYLNQALQQMREGLHGVSLEAPLVQSVMGDQPEANHLGLRLAYQAFGIGSALEDYLAMLESLAGISLLYIYFLANPAASDAHVAYAGRLLEIRNYEGVRPGDLPTSETNPSDYIREVIGHLYYALARMRRARGEPAGALTAFETSLAVREPLRSLSARKGVAATLHSLAGLLHAIGRDGEAKARIERAISMKESIYGTEPNEELSASLHNLGSILIKLGDFAGAEIAIHRSLDMKKAFLGTMHHVSVAETAMLAAWLLMERGGSAEAIPVLQFVQSVFSDLAPWNPQLAQVDAILEQLT